VGYHAGKSITTSASNVYIGKSAGYSTTTSYGSNVAIGNSAFYTNTTGYSQTAVGSGALRSNTTGNQSTAVGYEALYANTTASNNTAVGFYSLKANTTGASNAALGYQSMFTNTTGSNNTAVGYGASQLNTTGGSNTVFGREAGYANQTGEHNTFVGRSSGIAVTASNNTFVGRSAGSQVTSGSGNTIVGRYQGNSSGIDIRTGNNNIILSDGDGNPRLHIGADGDVGIGTPATGAKITAKQTTGNQVILHLEHDAGSNPYGIFMDFSNASPDNNTNYFLKAMDGSNTSRIFIWSDGDVQNHDNTYGALSDEKLKEQITDASSQWDDIKALTVRKYKMKTDVATGDSDAHWRLGVVAQEVETAGMNGLVKDNPDLDENNKDLGTKTKSVKYSILYMKAVKALQEAMARIETLEAEVKALKGE